MALCAQPRCRLVSLWLELRLLWHGLESSAFAIYANRFGGLLPSNHGSSTPDSSAVALTEPFAAFVSFQWHQPTVSRHQNVNSAPATLTPACHFSGLMAQIAIRLT